MTTNIYILKLKDNKYYIGKSENVMKRYQEHLNGSGSAWTKKYKPISLEKVIENASPFDEDRYVKEYMSKYGMENVRGGAYMGVDLSEEQEDTLRNELRATTDKCLKCGKAGHFASQCKRKTSFTANCGCGREFLDYDEYMGHRNMCLLRRKKEESESEEEEEEWGCDYCDRTFTTRFGCSLHEKSCTKKKTTKKTSGSCFRCGRPGHFSPDCYAQTHKNGYDLE